MKKIVKSASCIFVKGYFRGVNIDIQRNEFFYVPNELIDFVSLLETKSREEVFNETNSNLHSILENYFDFLLEKEVILEIPKGISKSSFIELDSTFYKPNIISNLVIEVEKKLINNPSIINELIEKIKCYDLQLIFIDVITKDQLYHILKSISEMGLKSIELVINISTRIDFNQVTVDFRNISFILLHSSGKTELIKENYFGIQSVLCIPQFIEPIFEKSINEFVINYPLYLESQGCNTYFNRKLFISQFGEIKNAKESLEVFGYYETAEKTLSLITSNDFQKYWYVHKDLCDVCKDCEFRHMCVDNRVPFERSENEWYHKIECNYNPFIAKWEGESGYKTLEECGVISNDKMFSIDHEKIKQINLEIWGE